MQITLETKTLAAIEAEALVTYVFEDGDPAQGKAAEIDQVTGGLLGRLSKSGEVTAKPLEMTLVHSPAGLKAARLLLIGAGKREAFNGTALRKLAGAALRYLKSRSVHGFVFAVREAAATEELAQALVEGLITADFETYK
jgi:leucyl aminopeptidase